MSNPDDQLVDEELSIDQADGSRDDALPPAADAKPFQFVYSDGFPELLESLGACLCVTTYQAGKLVTFRARQGGLSMLLRTFDKAMGLAVLRDRIAIGTTYQVWELRDSPDVAAKLKPAGSYDACFLPRRSHVTGNIDIHEMAYGLSQGSRGDSQEPEGATAPEIPALDTCLSTLDSLWFVNTLFSCLCTLDENFSFVPRWRPPFISEIRRHDCCHLNGMAMVDGLPKYVTAFGETGTREGWRPNKVDGGVVVDVESGATVARGLSMPHSPRVHEGRLWVLDSGRGRLCVVDPGDGKLETICELPGYTRGLAFAGRFALVGLSKIRETAVFGGVPIAEQSQDRKCGVWIVDTLSGQVVAFLDCQQSVEELFDVQLLRGVRNPEIVGFQKGTIQRACVIPPEQPINCARQISSRRR